METNRILSASWLDILFDNRNKDYGAYELRKSYDRRISKALLITAIIVALFFTGTTIAGSVREINNVIPENEGIIIKEYVEKKIPEKLPEPERTTKPKQQVKAQKYVDVIEIVKDNEINERTPSKEDLDNVQIGNETIDAPPAAGVVIQSFETGVKKGIIADRNDKESEEIEDLVEIQAKFIGNWTKFLLKYLNPNVPVENGAPAGRYTVIVQFVVDKEGNVSNIKALTKVGYGMEEEAIRVIKKATKWEPAIQNGYKVKAYRQQPITFEILGDE